MITRQIIKLVILAVSVIDTNAQVPANLNIEKAYSEVSYTDTIYLGTTKNSYIDLRGINAMRANISSGKSSIKIELQEYMLVLKALKKNFDDANMIIACKDSVLHFLVKYEESPRRSIYKYVFRKTGQIQNYLSTIPEGSLATSVKEPSHTDSSKTSLPEKELYNDVPALKREIYTNLRSRPANIIKGDLSGGIRATVDRLYYYNGQTYYYSVSLVNKSSSDFHIDTVTFEVQNPKTKLEYTPRIYASEHGDSMIKDVKAGAKESIVISSDKVALSPEEIVFININPGDLQNKKALRIQLMKSDYNRAVRY